MVYTCWKDVVHFWGWEMTDSPTSHNKQLLALPSFYGRQLSAADFRAYLQQLKSTEGQAEIPHSLQKLLASIACRSAIMFGDRLSNEEGQGLVDRLKGAKVCFQCAHGRPTMAPLVNLGISGRGMTRRQAQGQCNGRSRESVVGLKRKLMHHLQQ